VEHAQSPQAKSPFNLTTLRRALSARGFSPARWVPEASEGRAEEATIRPARLVEDDALRAREIGAAEPWPGPVAFLDGVQRYEVVGYAGASPIVVANIAAGVLERQDRRLQAMVELRRRLFIARAPVLATLADLLEAYECIALPDDEPPHPVGDFLQARRAVDRERGRLEREVGHDYRRRCNGWLVVDGSLGESPQWAADDRMLGIAKSHSTLPFGGEELERYLRLPAGSRSSVFAPASGTVAPVYSWALRLWPWEGKDLLHGLIRVEAAPTPETVLEADRISRWLLAERSPVSTPDARWDRLLYGIHEVEVYLRVRSKG
jgi:hypothetical protein